MAGKDRGRVTQETFESQMTKEVTLSETSNGGPSL